MRERERACVCVCEREREGARVCVCVCACFPSSPWQQFTKHVFMYRCPVVAATEAHVNRQEFSCKYNQHKNKQQRSEIALMLLVHCYDLRVCHCPSSLL